MNYILKFVAVIAARLSENTVIILIPVYITSLKICISYA